jgi:hypothetical protein
VVGSAGQDCAIGGGNGDINTNGETVDTQCPEDVGEEKQLKGLLDPVC